MRPSPPTQGDSSEYRIQALEEDRASRSDYSVHILEEGGNSEASVGTEGQVGFSEAETMRRGSSEGLD